MPGDLTWRRCVVIRGQQNPSSKKKNSNKQQNTQESHKALLGRLQDDAPLGGSRAADLAVRYRRCPLQSVLQDSYLAAAHSDTPTATGTELFLHNTYFASHISYIWLQNLSLLKRLSPFTTTCCVLYCQHIFSDCVHQHFKN